VGSTLDRRFVGRVALVTGAASGIGKAVAERLAADGACVVAVDHSDEIGAVAEGTDGTVHGMRVDVRRSDEVAAAVSEAVERFGGLQILCNIAGVIQRSGPLVDVEEDEFDRVIDTNLRGVFLGMKHGIPALIAGGGGVVVNVASIGGLVGRVGVSTYAASKGAVIQLSKSAALEYARAGVRINTVCPGPTKTNIGTSAWRPGDEPRAPVGTGAVYQKTIDAIPLHRFCEPSEIAGPICFLASDDASFMTGATVVVDGGLTVGMPGQDPRDPTS
jgi:NAD(P)-dependent dehydrogenase (short-subunit alcohol dehydrogenase family)